MKKTDKQDDLREKYTRADFPSGFVRGKYADRLAESSNVIVLDPEVAAVFPNDAAVNKALSSLISVARVAVPAAKSARKER